MAMAMTVAEASSGAIITATVSRASLASLFHISHSQELAISPSQVDSSPSRARARRWEVRAAKGFGEPQLQNKKKKGANAEPKGESLACPCGGGEERREFSDCCARYHGGVVEPDAVTLMKARFSAYAPGKVDYVVRTTHPDNPDFHGEDELANDVRATCEQLRFTRLEILDSESTSEDKDFVSFRVTHAVAKGGRAGDKQFLVEKSQFVKEGDRWLYRERIPISQASDAAWLNSTAPNFVNPKMDRKSFKSQPGLLPRK